MEIKRFNDFINEDFRPSNNNTPTYFYDIQSAKKYIMNYLLNNPTITLSDFIEQNKNYINRISDEYREYFEDAIKLLDIPYWNNPRKVY